MTEFMTVAESAALLRIGERTANKLVRSGRLPAVKVGNQWRIEHHHQQHGAYGRRCRDLTLACLPERHLELHIYLL